MDLRLENKVALDRRPESALPSLQDLRQKAHASLSAAARKSVFKIPCGLFSSGIRKAKLEPLAADLATAEAAEQTVSRFPAVDILINNLGVYGPKPFDALTDEYWCGNDFFAGRHNCFSLFQPQYTHCLSSSLCWTVASPIIGNISAGQLWRSTFGIEVPLFVRDDDLSDLVFGKRNVFASSYLSDSSFDNGNLVELSSVFQNDTYDLITHSSFRLRRQLHYPF
jgi:hypothetical protein